MKGVSAVFADAPSDSTLDEIGRRDVDVDNAGQLDPIVCKDLIKCIRLLDGARKAVQDEPLPAVRFAETLAYDADGDGIGNKLARIHIGLRLFAEGRPLLYGLTKHIARGDVKNAVPFYEVCCLRALAGTRRPHQNDVHRISFVHYFIKPS